MVFLHAYISEWSEADEKMVVLQFTSLGCTYVMGDLSEVVALELMRFHRAAISGTLGASGSEARKAPPIESPWAAAGSTEETWAMFFLRNGKCSWLAPTYLHQLLQHLLQCCEDSLGDDLLRGLPYVTATGADMLAAMKQLIVIPVAIGMCKNELIDLSQKKG